jgi:hypothetical protein
MQKKYFIVPVAAALFMVFANTVNAQTVATKPTGGSGIILPVDLSKTSSPEQRTTERQAKHKAELSKYTTQKVAAKCTDLTSKLKVQSDKDKTALSKRQEVYVKLGNNLADKVSRLNGFQIDTARLTNAQQAYTTEVNKYLMDSQNYKAALEDALGLNCAQNSTAFMANLLEARVLRTQLADDSRVIKTSIPDIESALNQVKTRVSK